MRIHSCGLCHIDLDGVSVRRGGQLLLQNVSMHIHCGQLTVLIGQNGAGKTTLIRALLGELPHSGTIRHLDSAGRDIPHLRTGYVPQNLLFDREMPVTVQDFLAASMTRRPVWTGVSKKIQTQVRQALADVEAEACSMMGFTREAYRSITGTARSNRTDEDSEEARNLF